MVVVGSDADGQALQSDELWAREKDADGTHTSWYRKAVEYWDKQAATYDGVLGGYGYVSDTDIRDSRNLLLKAFKRQLEEAETTGRKLCAIDTGAGVGRVTEQLLIHHFHTVDLLEPSQHLIDKAKATFSGPVAATLPAGHAVGNYYVQGLETWQPEPQRYDCIWIQWCLLYLTDSDFVPFFQRAAQGLKPDGLFFVKENVCQSGFVVDDDDCSLTRSNAYLLDLFKASNLSVVYNIKQKSFPEELYDVRMYILRPKAVQ